MLRGGGARESQKYRQKMHHVKRDKAKKKIINSYSVFVDTETFKLPTGVSVGGRLALPKTPYLNGPSGCGGSTENNFL